MTLFVTSHLIQGLWDAPNSIGELRRVEAKKVGDSNDGITCRDSKKWCKEMVVPSWPSLPAVGSSRAAV